MNGTASCEKDHQWRVSREAGRRFTLQQGHVASRAQRVAERRFMPDLCPTCGKPALRVVESRKRP